MPTTHPEPPLAASSSTPIPDRRFVPGFWSRFFRVARAGEVLLSQSSLSWSGASGTKSLRQSDCSGEVERRRRLFWHTLVIWSSRGAIRIGGLSGAEAVEWERALGAWLAPVRLTALEPQRARLKAGSRRAAETWAGDRFVRVREHKRTIEAIEQALASLAGTNWDRWGSEDDQRLEQSLRAAMRDAEHRRSEINEAHAQRVLGASKNLFDSIERNPLTDAQRRACVMADDNNLVLAGAGTGKTSVVLGRIAYLLASGTAAPAQVLAVAYNADAASELRERVRARITDSGIATGVTIRTFHALGMDIIGAVEGRKPSISKLAEDPVARDTFVSRTLDQLLGQPRYRRDFLEYGFHYLEPLTSVFDFPSMEAYERDRDDRDLRTLSGDRVRSVEELRIANWLTLQGVPFAYESPYPLDTADEQHRAYRPDFTIARPGHARGALFLEHFGVDERGNPPPFFTSADATQYRASMAWKRELHRAYETDLVETYSYEFRQGSIFGNLAARLAAAGVALDPKSDEECLQNLRDSQVVTQAGRFFAELLPLCREIGTIQAIEERLDGSPTARQHRSRLLWRLLRPVIQAYDRTLAEAAEIDFAEMLHRATGYVTAGRYPSPFREILVDEFQDISELRARFIKALRDQVPNAVLFCVGDDWQSIYRFAGADVGFTSQFRDRIGDGSVVTLDRTFRFNDRIGRVATQFITRNPFQTKKEITSVRTVRVPAVSLVSGGDPNALLEQILRRIAGWGRDRRARYSVRILARYKHELEGVADLTVELVREGGLELALSTVHASKGLECDFVVVIGLRRGRHGFPAEKPTDPFREFCLPGAEDFDFAEERRLFYVALTRARHRVYLLHDPVDCSVFIRELKRSAEEVVTDEFPPRGIGSPYTDVNTKWSAH